MASITNIARTQTDKYTIVFHQLILWLLPTFLRKSKMVSYLRCLIEPIRVLHKDFANYRKDAIYKVTHNSQVFSIENVLNDAFDKIERRIYIGDSFEGTPVYIYPRATNQPVYIYTRATNQPVYIYPRGDANPTNTDFVIYLPIAIQPVMATGEINNELQNLENRIKSFVDYYKLASKRYEIIWT